MFSFSLVEDGSEYDDSEVSDTDLLDGSKGAKSIANGRGAPGAA